MYTSVSTLIPTYDFTYSNCFSVPVVFTAWKKKEYVETRFLHQRQHWIRNQHKFLALGTTIYQLLVMASLWSKATRGFEEKTSDILNKDFALTWGGIMIAGLGHSSLGLFQFSFGKILIFLEGEINASSTGRETISFVPPSNSFVSTLDLWRAFWVHNGHGALQGHLAFLP